MWCGLYRPADITLKDGLNGEQEIELEETFVSAAMGPASFEAELVANLKPVSDLLNGCLRQVGGRGFWPGLTVVPGRT